MSLTVRRVVTGHDENGRAIVLIDENSKNVAQTRPGAQAAVIWTSEGFPVDNDGSADTSGRKVGSTLDNGIVFRVVSFGPGVTPRNHRTNSIDYATVIRISAALAFSPSPRNRRPGALRRPVTLRREVKTIVMTPSPGE